MTVGAKRLGTNLDRHSDRLVSHVGKPDTRYGVLTDGRECRTYDAGTATKSPKVEFGIADSDGVVIHGAMSLHRPAVSEMAGRGRDAPPGKPEERPAA